MPIPGAQAPPAAESAAAAAAIPFVVGSNCYREAPFSVTVLALGANSQETVVNITPGGFLRGITMQVTSAGGTLGPGVFAADSPYSILSSVSLEDISGGPILYPMGGFSHMLSQKYFRPWDGDPSKRASFTGTIGAPTIAPSFTMRFFAEVKDTLGVLANTDARAQYRFRFTLAPATSAGPFGLFTTAPTTPPTVTVKLFIESWSQPDLQDLLGNPIEQLPDGLCASRFLMHEQPVFNSGNNVVRMTLVGNELRGIIAVVRNGDANKSRVDLTDANAGSIDFRLDARRIWKMNPSQLIEEMAAYYPFLGNGTWTRETGVFVFPRFAGAPDPGSNVDGQGEYWLQTVEQTLMQWELNGSDITTPPGSIEFIYDALAIAGQVPAHLEGA